MPNDDLEKLSASLFRLFGKLGARPNTQFFLQPLWREAAGPVAERTKITGMERGVLKIVAEFSFAAPIRAAHDILVSRINARLDPYHQIRRIEVSEELPMGQAELPFLRNAGRAGKGERRPR